jgi:ABC-type proline/glycine betaine transport system substrate-binding protein
VPRYVLEDVPSVLAADFTNPTVASYFNNTFIVGDKAWSGPEQTIIAEYGYDLRVEVLSGQEEFVAMLAERYAREEPMVFFLWNPNPLMSMYDFVRITLPEDGKLEF